MSWVEVFQPGGTGVQVTAGALDTKKYYVAPGTVAYFRLVGVAASVSSWSIVGPSGSAASIRSVNKAGLAYLQCAAIDKAGEYTVSVTGADAVVYPLFLVAADSGARAASEAIAPFNDTMVDDLSAFDAFISAMGDTTVTRGARLELPDRMLRISNTVLFDRKSPVIYGAGFGSSKTPQSCIKWAGPAGSPMIRFRRAWGAKIQDVRLVGDSNNKPSAAIDARVESGDSPQTFKTVVSHCWIGSMSGEDNDNASQFTSGITFSGLSSQNDQSCVYDCSITGYDLYGVHFPNGQSTIIHIAGSSFNAGVSAVAYGSRGLIIESCFGSSLTNFAQGLADSGVHLKNIGCEAVGRLFYHPTGVGLGITVEGEYFQCNAARLPVDGSVGYVNCLDDNNGAAHVVLRNMNFSSDGTVAAGQAKLVFRGCKTVILEVYNTGWYDDDGTLATFCNHFDLDTTAAGQTRLVIYEYRGVRYVNYWEHGATTLRFSQRIDLPFATVPTGHKVRFYDSGGVFHDGLQLLSAGPLSGFLQVGDATTPVATPDLKAIVAGCDIRDYRTISGLLGYVEQLPMVAPANPLGGWRVYVDTADGKLKARNSAGTVRELAIP